MSNLHIPVLLNEAIENLNIIPDGIYVDMTLGRAGHSSKILEKLQNGWLYSFDRDDEAIEFSNKKLKCISNNFKIIKTNFSKIKSVLEKENIDKVDGILFDLGVSSPQFDEGYRGFSYREDAELDMRMNTEDSLTAKIIVNTYSLKQLSNLFRDYGEEKFAYQIAQKIVMVREVKPIETTFELVDIIKSVLPAKVKEKHHHPAKKVFQALRIEVNDEFGELKKALTDSLNLLNKGGRIVVITFNSLEDRIVKNIFKDVTCLHDTGRNLPPSNEVLHYKLINKKVIEPTAEEIENNLRALPSKMRVIERID